MAQVWYFVEGGERKGPVEENQLIEFITAGKLAEEDYVWSKGFDNWKKIEDVASLVAQLPEEEEVVESAHLPTFDQVEESDFGVEEEEIEENNEPVQEDLVLDSQEEDELPPEFDVSSISEDERVFTIKIGRDRGLEKDNEYGPYSLNILKKLYKEKRINGKTQIYAPGMVEWQFLAALSTYQELFEELPPQIEDGDRRSDKRRPFVAKMLFHNQSKVFEGVCRDISVGGMQILVHDFPGKIGEKIQLNVHPDNSKYSFVASGQIVRVLEGGQGFSFRFIELSAEAQDAINNYVKA